LFFTHEPSSFVILLFCLDRIGEPTKKYRSGPTWNGTAKKNQADPAGAARPGLPARGSKSFA
jgi:hypothetical protein